MAFLERDLVRRQLGKVEWEDGEMGVIAKVYRVSFGCDGKVLILTMVTAAPENILKPLNLTL